MLEMLESGSITPCGGRADRFLIELGRLGLGRRSPRLLRFAEGEVQTLNDEGQVEHR